MFGRRVWMCGALALWACGSDDSGAGDTGSSGFIPVMPATEMTADPASPEDPVDPGTPGDTSGVDAAVPMEPTPPDTEQPTDPIEEPTDPIEEPTDPIEEPTDPIEEPTDPIEEPTDPIEEPTDPIEEPTDPIEEPTDPVEIPPLVEGCPGQQLREGIPEDLGAPGPWPVGAVTTQLGGITTEVWYPAVPGTQAGVDRVVYDIREQLPPANQTAIPDANNPWQVCDCFEGIPLDAEAGPFPVVVFVHGTGGWRTTNMENAVHWASRGFVVAASDHPGIKLGDIVTGSGSTDQAGDARRVLEELLATTGDAAFLAGRIDPTRVAAMGHSAGGNAVSSLGDVADVIIPYAGGGAIAADRVDSTLYVTGDMDSVVAPSTAGYDGAGTAIRRQVYISRGGHIVGGSMCTLRDPTDPSKDLVDIAGDHQALGPIGTGLLLPFFGGLFDGCNELMDDPEPFIPVSRGIEVLNYVTAGQLEETLHCSDTAAGQLAQTQARFGEDVSLYQESLP